MLRFTAIRNVIAVITMTVAALCGGGKAIASQNGIFSAVEVQNSDTHRLEGGKGQTSLAPANTEAVIVSGNVAISEKGVFDTSYATRAKVAFALQNKRALLPTSKSADQIRKLDAFVRPRTRAPPVTSQTG